MKAYDFFGKASARGKAAGGLGLPMMPAKKPRMMKRMAKQMAKSMPKGKVLKKAKLHKPGPAY